MESICGKATIVGMGEIPTGLFPDRSFAMAAVDVCEMAIKDAGIPKKEIDTIIPFGVVRNAFDNTLSSRK